jgi:L-amino acid N-acyltransferase YncA
MTQPFVRLVQAADLASITDIYAHHVRDGAGSFELQPPSQLEMGNRVDAIVGSGLPYLVAEVVGEIIGYAYAAPYRSRPAYRYTVEDSVYVASGCVGRGVGSALLAEIVARCECLGLRQLIAVIGDSANQSSIRLHERAGFTHAGKLASVGWKHGRWLDSVLMQRSLGAGADAAAN